MADIQKSEATLVKKVWDIAGVLAAVGVGTAMSGGKSNIKLPTKNDLKQTNRAN